MATVDWCEACYEGRHEQCARHYVATRRCACDCPDDDERDTGDDNDC